MIPWYISRPRELEELRWELTCRYPTLRVEFLKQFVTIVGSYPLVQDGELIERFDVLIVLLDDYPQRAPLLLETGEKIPDDIDRHMVNRVACTFLPEAQWRDFPRGSTLFDFLDGPVRQFFINQLGFESTGQWPIGEWRHGTDGVLDFYEAEFGTRDVLSIERYLQCLATEQTRGHFPCPCGSGRHLRACHAQRVAELRRILPPDHALFCLQRLRKLFPKNFGAKSGA